MELTTIDNGVPGHLMNRRASGTLAAARAGVQGSFAVIGYLGKNWRVKFRGEETIIKDQRGQPVHELDVVIVGTSPNISKNYYAKGYTRGDDAAPDCFSLDGKVPDSQAPHKQNPTCDNCPQNQWGSQMTPDGKKAKACRDSRRLAVVPLGDIANEAMGGPMLLRLPPTTLLNFASYADFLERKGVGGMEWVGTRLTFDEDLAYPRICFNAISYVTEEQDAEIAEVMQSPMIDRLLHAYGPTESAPAAVEGDDVPGTPPARKAASVTSLPARRAQSDPPREPPPEPEDEEETPPTAPNQPEQAPPASASAAKRNPFLVAPAPAPAPARVARGARMSAPTKPAPAPNGLEDAISDLLDQPA